MYVLRTLFHLDLLAIRHWFKTERLSKLLVILGFVLLSLSLVWVIYKISRLFFDHLSSLEIYGQLTAVYLLNATLVLLAWFGIGSTIASQLTFYFAKSASHRYLMTLPIPSGKISAWQFVRSFFLNLVLVGMIFTPMLVSFYSVFGSGRAFWISYAIILTCFILMVQSTGILVSLVIARYLTRVGWPHFFFGIVAFLSSAYFILNLILPKSLTLLYFAEPNQFLPIYNSLPLLNPLLPSYWITEILTGSLKSYGMLPLVTLTLGLTLLAIELSARNLLPLFQRIYDRSKKQFGSWQIYGQQLQRKGYLPRLWRDQTGSKNTPNYNYTFGRQALILKDVLTVLRNSNEAGYGVFLLSLVAFFFLLLRYTRLDRLVANGYSRELALFSLFWFLFFTTAFLLRIVFPLVSREGKSARFIFTLPLSHQAVFFSKLKVSLLLCLPLIGLGIVVWQILPFSENVRTLLTLVSIWGVVALTLTNLFLGMVQPNFTLGSTDPEKVSTSVWGILSLAISLFFSGSLIFELNYVLAEEINFTSGLLTTCLLQAGILAILANLAKYSLKKYEF